jgi:hypothetical protein
VDFALFLIATAIVFTRPTDLVPGLESIQLYLMTMLLCTLVSCGVLMKELAFSSLKKDPVAACVALLAPAIVMSDLANLRVVEALFDGLEFAKALVYFLLLAGLVNSLSRLRVFLHWSVICLVVVVSLAILHHREYVRIPGFVAYITDPVTHEILREAGDGRLRGSGLFGDPNDVCLCINLGIMATLYAAMSARKRTVGILWLAPLCVFFYGLKLTESRAGLLAGLAGIGVMLLMRYGVRKGLILVCIFLPPMLALFAGRQTDFDTSGRNTGQLRIQFWSDAMMIFTRSPLLGIGMQQSEQRIGKAVHNTFMQSYSDLGFVGGTLLVGAFFEAFRRLWRSRRHTGLEPGSDLARLQPFILAILTAYAVNMATTNQLLNVVTYAMLGLATAYVRIVDHGSPPPSEMMNGRTILRLVLVSVAFLVLLRMYILFAVRY